jgi:EmrB/QacA subfamily drug resistance transporter
MTSASPIPPPAPEAAQDRLPPELIKLALTVMLGAVMVALDATMVNVALNTLVRDFHTSVATIQWVSTGYLLALAMVIPFTGWAVERFGAKPMWIASITIFIAGSMLCGLAWSAASLIVFRVVQGIGGGMILPLIQTILAQAAGPARIGRVMAVIGVPAMLGPVLGPVLGGVIVSDASWRLIFYINLPICLVALLASRRVAMPDTTRPAAFRLDLLGLSLLSPALVALVYGLSQAGTHGSFTDSHVLLPAAVGVALLVGFCAHALRTTTEPIIDLRLFGNHNFTSCTAVVFFFSMAMLGTALLLPLYYQQVRGEDALHAGLLLAPQGVGMGVALVLASRLTDRTGPRPLILIGLALTALGTLPYTRVGPDTSVVLLSAAALVSGLGIGAALVPAMAGAYRGLAKDAIPRATSSIRVFQQLGGSFGIAIVAVVLQQQATERATAAGQASATTLAAAFGHTFWWALAFTALAFVPTLLLPHTPASNDHTPLEVGATTPRDPRPPTPSPGIGQQAPGDP